MADRLGTYIWHDGKFIKWEEELGPSVTGYIYLRDLKEEILKCKR